MDSDMMATCCALLAVGLLVVLAACATTPMRWERSGTADAAKDEAECRVAARQEAAGQLPYGDGPTALRLHQRRQHAAVEDGN